MSFIVNKDKRRTLYEYVQDEQFKSAKVLFIEADNQEIGNHFHNNKEELFFLAKGKFVSLQVGELFWFNVEAPHLVRVPKGKYHKFVCEKGSILLGVATEKYDPKDEIKVPTKSIVSEHY